MTLLPADIQARIVAKAESDWPGNPEMQKYLLDKQSQACLALVRAQEQAAKNEYTVQIFEFACTSWPDDYEMALHTVTAQFAASKAFFEYEDAAVPDDVLRQIKEKTFADWPGDYEMKLHMLETRVEAWLTAKRG